MVKNHRKRSLGSIPLIHSFTIFVTYIVVRGTERVDPMEVIITPATEMYDDSLDESINKFCKRAMQKSLVIHKQSVHPKK